jgi:hypothetical protein
MPWVYKCQDVGESKSLKVIFVCTENYFCVSEFVFLIKLNLFSCSLEITLPFT